MIKVEKTVKERGLLLDEEVDLLISEAGYENIPSESKGAAAGGAAAGVPADSGGG